MSDAPKDKDTEFRAKLGLFLILGSSIAVILLSITIIVAAAITDKGSVKDSATLILSTVLPLLGTWVGTVLAFYYTKENFESASRSTLDIVKLIDRRLSSLSVAEQMMPVNQIVKIVIPANVKLADVALAEIAQQFAKLGSNGQILSRLIILDAQGVFVAVLHRSIWMEMLHMGSKLTPPVDITTDNFSQLLALSYTSLVGTNFSQFITKTAAFVAKNATLADAKAAMERTTAIQDVIVTQTGLSTEPMLGWITNVDIARLSQA